jgi:hypothetical protein
VAALANELAGLIGPLHDRVSKSSRFNARARSPSRRNRAVSRAKNVAALSRRREARLMPRGAGEVNRPSAESRGPVGSFLRRAGDSRAERSGLRWKELDVGLGGAAEIENPASE